MSVDFNDIEKLIHEGIVEEINESPQLQDILKDLEVKFKRNELLTSTLTEIINNMDDLEEDQPEPQELHTFYRKLGAVEARLKLLLEDLEGTNLMEGETLRDILNYIAEEF